MSNSIRFDGNDNNNGDSSSRDENNIQHICKGILKSISIDSILLVAHSDAKQRNNSHEAFLSSQQQQKQQQQ